jgi:hypothetical protein
MWLLRQIMFVATVFAVGGVLGIIVQGIARWLAELFVKIMEDKHGHYVVFVAIIVAIFATKWFMSDPFDTWARRVGHICATAVDKRVTQICQ